MITFAIPYYRGFDFLKKALRSVQAQTDPNWKAIVVDDGGDDEAQAFVRQMGDARLSYVRNPERLGMVDNWNRCLDLAQTETVSLLHADDELLPHYAQTMAQGWMNYPKAGALFCRTRIIDDKSGTIFSFPDFYKGLLTPAKTRTFELYAEGGLRLLLKGCFLFCPTACFRKLALSETQFSARWKMVQDLDLWARMLLSGARLVGLPQVAYAYRRHGGNSTVEYTRSLLRFREEAQLYRELAAQLEERGWRSAARTARRASVVRLNLAYCLAKDLATFQFAAAGDKARFLFSHDRR